MVVVVVVVHVTVLNTVSDAGFEEIVVNEIKPEWYREVDRSHGLIMGFVVTGTRPLGRHDDPAWPGSCISQEARPEAAAGAAGAGVLHALLWLPRFLLGNIGGIYYALLPIFIFLQNTYCGESAAATWLGILVPVLPILYCTVLPVSFRPFGDDKKLYDGIADFYNRSSSIWEQVWGEHMHSGFYGPDGAVRRT